LTNIASHVNITFVPVLIYIPAADKTDFRPAFFFLPQTGD